MRGQRFENVYSNIYMDHGHFRHITQRYKSLQFKMGTMGISNFYIQVYHYFMVYEALVHYL